MSWSTFASELQGFYDSWLCGPLQFLLLAFLIYELLYYLRGTRAVNVLAGIIIGSLLLSLISKAIGFTVIESLLEFLITLLGMALVVIFQPELRRAFAQLGSYAFFQRDRKKETISELVIAVEEMSKRRIGALIVLERKIGMRALMEDSVKLDCKLGNLLLQSLFYPNSPLHDGAVIVRDERIVAARAILPLSRNANLSRTMGTRHRAALGITEETDAAVVVVSEETGDISIAFRGTMMHALSRENLVAELHRLLLGNTGADESLTDILGAPDEREGAVDFHGDGVPTPEECKQDGGK